LATLILQDTYQALEEELKTIDKLRSQTAMQIQEAASHGDLKENYEYKAAKEKMEFVLYKKQLLQSYAPFKFIEFGDIGIKEVGFGSKVTIHEEGKVKPLDYYLLGPIESELNLYPMTVTYHTPFAKAIMGKKVGEEFTLNIRDNDVKFTIKSIEKISKAEKKVAKK
jgi:transcription elongation factor GreA